MFLNIMVFENVLRIQDAKIPVFFRSGPHVSSIPGMLATFCMCLEELTDLSVIILLEHLVEWPKYCR